ncbi:MAG: hypothetical protein PVG49_09150 [Desulfobacteraceae bacterium]|jgi:hypothetical protein
MGILNKNIGECFSEILTKWMPKNLDSLPFLHPSGTFKSAKFKNISKCIHDHSTLAAREFAELLAQKPSHDTVHFFFDYFLCFYFMIAKPNRLPGGKDSILPFINRMHMEYYGKISGQIVQSVTDVWMGGDPCFFNSFIHIIRHKNRYHLIIPMAVRSIDPTISLNESKLTKMIPSFQHIQNAKLRNIDATVSSTL